MDNAEVLRRVRERFQGDAAAWPQIASAIERVFGLCRTRERFLAAEGEAHVADQAVAAARHCLEVNATDLSEVDLVVNGSIAREYLEPATAMEVAAKLGLEQTHAFDVTAACVGHLEALQAAAGHLLLHPEYRSALVCTSELTGDYLSYDVQTLRDLRQKSAGLTIGNAAACVLMRREPWPGGGVRVLGMHTRTVPKHYDLCQVPLQGKFESSSVELMRLGKLVPPVIRENLARLGWTPEDVDHFVLHQPSEAMVRQILEDLGVPAQRAVYSHSRYGNTASASVGVSLDLLLREHQVQTGDKIVLGSAAAGFSMVMICGQWHSGNPAVSASPVG